MMEDVSVPSTPAAAPKVRLLSLIAVLVLAADLVTKVVAVVQLEGRDPVKLLDGLVYLQLVRNPGAAFSLATGYTWLLTIVAFGVVVVIVRVARRLRSTGWAVALGLVLGGALGNLTDRIFRAPGPLQGHVVDMVSLFAPDGRAWPVFNVADSSIVSGGVLLVLLALLGRELDGTRTRDRAKADQGADTTEQAAAGEAAPASSKGTSKDERPGE
jgi:signal peptidase II